MNIQIILEFLVILGALAMGARAGAIPGEVLLIALQTALRFRRSVRRG